MRSIRIDFSFTVYLCRNKDLLPTGIVIHEKDYTKTYRA